MFITIFKDPEGLPRGWGKGKTKKQSQTYARWQAKEYCKPGNSGYFRGWTIKSFSFETKLDD